MLQVSDSRAYQAAQTEPNNRKHMLLLLSVLEVNVHGSVGVGGGLEGRRRGM